MISWLDTTALIRATKCTKRWGDGVFSCNTDHVPGYIKGNNKESKGRVLFNNGWQTTLVRDKFAETIG